MYFSLHSFIYAYTNEEKSLGCYLDVFRPPLVKYLSLTRINANIPERLDAQLSILRSFSLTRFDYWCG